MFYFDICLFSDEEVEAPVASKKQNEKTNKKPVKVGKESDEEEDDGKLCTFDRQFRFDS